jgi:hypothetical protein
MNRYHLALFALLFASSLATAWAGKYNLYELPTPKAPTLTLIAGGSLPVGRTYCVKMAAGGRGMNFYGENLALTMLSRPSRESNCVTTTAGNQNINITFEDCGADCAGYLFYLNTTPGGYSPRPNYWNVTETNRVSPKGAGYCGVAAETAFSKANSTTLYWGNFSSINPAIVGTAYAGWVDYYPVGIPFINITGGTALNPVTPQDIYMWLQSLNATQEIMDCSPVSGIRSNGGSWECGTYKLRASLGEMGVASYGTNFNIPLSKFVDQEWGKLTFNAGGNFTIGSYSATTDAAVAGGVYRRTACYPLYNQVVSYDWNGAWLGGGYTLADVNATYGTGLYYGPMTQMSQTADAPLWRMVSTVFYATNARIYPTISKYVTWKYSTVITESGGEMSGGKTGFSARSVDYFRLTNRANYIGSFSYIVENLYWNTVISSNSAGVGGWVISHLYRNTVGNTTIGRCINCREAGYTGVVGYVSGPFNATAEKLIWNKENTLSLKVVDQTNTPIENAQVRIYNRTGYQVGQYAAAPFAYLGQTNSNWTNFGNILYLNSTNQLSVGDILYIGDEYLNVTSIINYSACTVTRGMFQSVINQLAGVNIADPTYYYSLNVYWGNHTWATNSTGDLPLLNLVPNATRKVTNTLAAAYFYFDYFVAQGPFRIEVNASGYQNATYYYQPSGPGAYSLALMNATACDGECNASQTIYLFDSAQLTNEEYLRITSTIPEVPKNVPDPNLLIVGAGAVMLGLFFFARKP